eukprot:COSAG04_NODE_67_length_29431_cov_17.894313_7_plen_87_part_00
MPFWGSWRILDVFQEAGLSAGSLLQKVWTWVRGLPPSIAPSFVPNSQSVGSPPLVLFTTVAETKATPAEPGTLPTTRSFPTVPAGG